MTMPLRFELSSATEQAIKVVKAAGGEVTIRYRTPLKLREHLYPEKYPMPLRDPLPSQKHVYKLELFRTKGSHLLIPQARM